MKRKEGRSTDQEAASGGQLAPEMKGQEGRTELWRSESSLPTHPAGESVYLEGRERGVSGAGDPVFEEVRPDHKTPAGEVFSSNTSQSASVPNII